MEALVSMSGHPLPRSRTLRSRRQGSPRASCNSWLLRRTHEQRRNRRPLQQGFSPVISLRHRNRATPTRRPLPFSSRSSSGLGLDRRCKQAARRLSQLPGSSPSRLLSKSCSRRALLLPRNHSISTATAIGATIPAHARRNTRFTIFSLPGQSVSQCRHPRQPGQSRLCRISSPSGTIYPASQPHAPSSRTLLR
jgi:hypothetical protein